LKIARVETFILHVPVTGGAIADSMHAISHWGMPGAVVHTDDGRNGYGFAGTHAHLPTDRLITGFISETAAPMLIGQPLNGTADIERLWSAVYHFPPAQWVGRSGITHLGLAALDIALWDLIAKDAGVPLWRLLGRRSDPPPLEAYDTDGGWLHLSEEQIVDNCRRAVEECGFRGVKIKVGKPGLAEDLRRVAAVRRAVGPEVKFMVDANGKWDLATALTADPVLAEHDVFWVEEPLWYDDLEAHRRLAEAARVPIALGEQLYSEYDFRDFIGAGAVRFVQPDVTRLGGISEWLRVADRAHEAGLPVAAHVGDMAQIHVQTCLAHPACAILEHIPWIRDCFEEPITVRDGVFVRPESPGAGTTFRPGTLERYGR
jgi:L-alanine-DL-glutamate epimerase-like enolase superfamily enzyme